MNMQTKRAAFTLVELMVAMTLTLFVMVILSQAFVLSLETFSGMKGIGDMQQNLRVASVLLRDDLSQDHFEGKRRLSDIVQLPTGPAAGIVNQPPLQGFFAILQGSAPINEGNDASNMPSYRATNNLLYMTVKRKGNRTENFFSNALIGDAATLGTFFSQSTAYNVPASPDMPNTTWASPYLGGTQGFYNTQWAEVLYYLLRTGTTEEPNNQGPLGPNETPTFSLYRAQFGMVPDATGVNTSFANVGAANAQALVNAQPWTFSSLSCNAIGSGVTFYSPADAALGNRFSPNLAALAPNARLLTASTLVLPNVTSFHIQAKVLSSAAVAPNFADVAAYDTTKFGQAGYLNNGLKGIQITLRVWDPKTRQTRQITVIQDL